MSAPATEAPVKALEWLKEQAAAVKRLEAEAEDALYNKSDNALYHKLMVQKASLLAAIKSDAVPFLDGVPEQLRSLLLSRLAAFSQGAQNALSLDSTFYMSALLYPDEHVPGQPNNLELLIAALENGHS